MRLDLRNIIHTPGKSVLFDYELDMSDVTYYDTQPIPEPVRVSGIVRNMAGALTLEGKVSVCFHLTCDRCLKASDYIIDIGPEGGDGGGTVVAKGTPEEVAKNPASYTGRYVAKYLK